MRILPVPKNIKTGADAPVRAFAPTVEANGAFAEATAAFQRYAQALCGLEVRAVADGAAIRVEEDAALAAEAYRLVIDGAGVRLFAADPAGANHAFATLLQLLQADAGRLMLPEAVVEDQPDAGYRGLMVDLARCWHPLSYLLSYVDMCFTFSVNYIKSNFHRPLAVKELLAALGISYTYLLKIFKERTGLSPKGYISELRMLHAKKLLNETNATVTQIANSVGYADVMTFSRFFTAREKLSPTQYRACARNEKPFPGQ